MNKQDFFTLIVKKRFYNKSPFRISILVHDEKPTGVLIKWIWDHDFIKDQIAPLKTWSGIGFLLSPAHHFTTQDFTTSVDIIAVNASLEVEYLFSDVEPNTKVDYQNRILSTIVLPHSYIAQYQIAVGQKFKFKKYKKTSKSWLENY